MKMKCLQIEQTKLIELLDSSGRCLNSRKTWLTDWKKCVMESFVNSRLAFLGWDFQTWLMCNYASQFLRGRFMFAVIEPDKFRSIGYSAHPSPHRPFHLFPAQEQRDPWGRDTGMPTNPLNPIPPKGLFIRRESESEWYDFEKGPFW